MPRYPYPVLDLVAPVLRVLLGLPCSTSRAAAMMVRGIRPTPRVLYAENVPTEASFILVMNHFERPSLGAWWGALVVLNAVANRRTCEPREVHMVMAQEWWYAGRVERAFKQPITRWFFGRLAKSYGLVLLPPVIGNDAFRGEGAIGVRHALRLTRSDPPLLIGVAPEGRTGEHAALCQPPRGAGLFLLALSRNKVPFLPAGIFEDDDQILTVRFGKLFRLSVDRAGTRAVQDVQAAGEIMIQIGKLLPPRMWGEYHKEIKNELEGR